MKGASPFMAWLSKNDGMCARAWHRMSSPHVCLCLCVVALCVFGAASFPSMGVHAVPLTGNLGAFLTTVSQAFLAVMLAFGANSLVLCLAPWSRIARSFLRCVSSFFATLPLLATVPLLLLVLSPFWSVVSVTAFGLAARALQTLLWDETTIPSAYHKTARSLRMGAWQRFWRIHIPLALPKLAQSVQDDISDFWVRLLGAQALVALLHPTASIGYGAQLVHAVSWGHKDHVLVMALGVLVIGMLLYRACISPLKHRSHRYDIGLSAPSLPLYEDDIFPLWQKIALIGVLLVSAVPLVVAYFYHFHEYLNFTLRDIAFSLISISIMGIISAFLFCLSEVRKNRKTVYSIYCVICIIFMSFSAFMSVMLYFYLTLIFMFAFGIALFATAFSRTKDDNVKVFYKTAQHLRLTKKTLFWRVKLPLLIPTFFQTIDMSLQAIWNSLYLIGIVFSFSFIPGTVRVTHWPLDLCILSLCVITWFALMTRYGILRPMQRFLSRKYKVPS